jgi:hypothetical protein
MPATNRLNILSIQLSFYQKLVNIARIVLILFVHPIFFMLLIGISDYLE